VVQIAQEGSGKDALPHCLNQRPRHDTIAALIPGAAVLCARAC
jgi:hypothetical protein